MSTFEPIASKSFAPGCFEMDYLWSTTFWTNIVCDFGASALRIFPLMFLWTWTPYYCTAHLCMTSTPIDPSIGFTPEPMRWRKATKQLATLGPASSTFEMIEKLFLAGKTTWWIVHSCLRKHETTQEYSPLEGFQRFLFCITLFFTFNHRCRHFSFEFLPWRAQAKIGTRWYHPCSGKEIWTSNCYSGRSSSTSLSM